jgi:class 3 adenylate cyclase/YHS domain-containing protein
VAATEHTFVFADLAGYTALTEAHGDGDAARIATTFHELATSCLDDDVHLVKTIGDEVMLCAASTECGIAVALRIADAVTHRAHFPAVRIGIHTGSAECLGGDYFGAAVNLAARVAGVARGGEIVCTERVAASATRDGLASVRPIGVVRLKNVVAPVALFELSAGHARTALSHIDPVCRMQVSTDDAATTLVVEGTTVYFCSSSCAQAFRAAPEQYLAPPR